MLSKLVILSEIDSERIQCLNQTHFSQFILCHVSENKYMHIFEQSNKSLTITPTKTCIRYICLIVTILVNNFTHIDTPTKRKERMKERKKEWQKKQKVK